MVFWHSCLTALSSLCLLFKTCSCLPHHSSWLSFSPSTLQQTASLFQLFKKATPTTRINTYDNWRIIFSLPKNNSVMAHTTLLRKVEGGRAGQGFPALQEVKRQTSQRRVSNKSFAKERKGIQDPHRAVQACLINRALRR
ncbi:hypothetical protein HD806DRAFT_292659 [Xylariaceae sp. AK1471]|nr:hypothetical protein HD806DRAFT_292659 [Xylariaceae sp. AK1471]